MRLRALLVLLLLATPVWACLNSRDSDTDSLTNEVRQLPELTRVLTGRFERNPPLFYQLRIQREQKELATNPKLWGNYDDIAVGYDRLGDDDAAISWIEKKRALLPAYPAEKEAWYRYFANVGTFRIHRWLHNGAKPETVAEAQRACAEIRRAIEIKPDAHFGRERYQLLAMEWILTDRKSSFTGYVFSHRLPSDTSEKAITGLAGLIVLGAAWESVDVTDALVAQIAPANLAHFANLRTKELLAQGKKSLSNNPLSGATREGSNGREIDPTNEDLIEKKYRELRKEADSWQGRRTEYVLARLQQGRHPDTDTAFWKEWSDGTPPGLDFSLLDTAPRVASAAFFRVVFWGAILFPLWGPVVAITVIVVKKYRAAR